VFSCIRLDSLWQSNRIVAAAGAATARMPAPPMPVPPASHFRRSRPSGSQTTRDPHDAMDRKGWAHQEIKPKKKKKVELAKVWVMCTQCKKWRRVLQGSCSTKQLYSGGAAGTLQSAQWRCYFNPDETRNTCGAPEEHPLEELVEYMQAQRLRVAELFNLMVGHAALDMLLSMTCMDCRTSITIKLSPLMSCAMF